MNKYVKAIINGIITENPVFVPPLGMCPTLATATSVINGLSMGLVTTFVLICSSVVIPLLRRLISDAIRIPAFIVIIAGPVTIPQMVIKAYIPAFDRSLGIFVLLIAVNCIVPRRAESTTSKSSVDISLSDGVDVGLGFTIELTFLATVHEVFGGDTFFGMRAYPDDFSALLSVLSPGTFIALGLLISIYHAVTKER